MTTAYLGLGSNLGDRRATLRRAIDHIAAADGISVTGESEVYETAPVGPQDQPSFFNQVVAISCDLDPWALMVRLLAIETELGRAPRTPDNRWGPRVIDLDILLFGNRAIDQPGLTVPHPRMHQRWFVLKPLADLAPDLVIPGQSEPVSALLAQVDPGEA